MAYRRRSRVTRQIRVIRHSLTSIDRALRSLSASVRETERVAQRSADTTRRKLKLSPSRRAALKLQGRYMGYLRQLSPRQKPQVKALKVKKGYHAAIALAKRLAKA